MTCKKFDHIHGFLEVIYTSLEHGGRSDNKVLKRMKPQQTGIDVRACDSVCGGVLSTQNLQEMI